MGPILLGPLEDLLAGWRPAGSGGNNGGGSSGGGGKGGGKSGRKGSSGFGGGGGFGGGVQLSYDAHLPALSLRDGEDSRNLLAGMVLPTLYVHIICKTGTCVGCVGRNVGVKTCMFLPPWRWQPPSLGCSKQPGGIAVLPPKTPGLADINLQM